MLSLWEVLKASKGLPAPDEFTALFAKSLTGIVSEISGIPPLNLGKVKDVVDYTLYGNTIQNGSPTPNNPVEVHAVGDYDTATGKYKIPVETRGKNLWKSDIVQFDNIGGSGDLYWYFGINSDFAISATAKKDVTVPKDHYLGITKNGGDADGGYTWLINPVQSERLWSAGETRTLKSSDKNFYFVSMYNTSVDVFKWITDNFYIMLNTGTTPEPYEPYHEPITTTAYLDKPLYKIGDYADSINYAEQKAERVVKEYTVNITKIITLTSGNVGGVSSTFDADANEGIGFCDKAPYGGSSAVDHFYVNKPNCVFVAAPGTTLEEMKAKYDGAKVYYVLAEPETESVTLPKIPTLDGTTVIDVETEIKPSNMYVKYKSRR